MSAAAKKAPDVEAILRAEVAALHDELDEVRAQLRVERARRETMVDLAGCHVRSFIAFVEHVQRELAQDAVESKRSR